MEENIKYLNHVKPHTDWDIKSPHMVLRIWPVTSDEYDGIVECMHEIMAAHNKVFHATWIPEGVG